MLTYWHDVDMFKWGRIVLSLPKRAHVDCDWTISREKYLKMDWLVCKIAVALAHFGSCAGSLVMGHSYDYIFGNLPLAYHRSQVFLFRFVLMYELTHGK